MTNETTPKDIKLRQAQQDLQITWADGSCSEIPAHILRRNCPCATCKTERQNAPATALPILKQSPAELRLHGAKLAGHYALQLVWSDGHEAGIFEYTTLRKLGDEASGQGTGS